MWAVWNLYLRDWLRDKHGRVRRFDNIIGAIGASAQEVGACQVCPYGA